MYTCFLLACVALLVLCPVAFELLLTSMQYRAERRRANLVAKERGPGIAWASLQ